MGYEVPNIRGKRESVRPVVIDDFSKGYNDYLDEGRTALNMVRESYNMMQDQDGIWVTRPQTRDFGAELTGPVDGGGKFVKDDGDGTQTEYVWVIDNGAFKYSADGGPWTTVAGVTWTTGNMVSGLQIKGRLYLSNGVDALAYYDIAADTLNDFSGLSTPGAPTATRGAGLSTGDYDHFYRITAVNEVGETIAGPSDGSVATDPTTDTDKPRYLWVPADDEYIDLSWSAVSGAQRYNIYYADASGFEVFLDSVAGLDYRDDGARSVNEYIEAPLDDTTTGPKVKYLALSGNRMWGVGDPDNPYRVYWGGVGQYQGAFSPFYGGGWVELEKGGPEWPKVAKDFHDGRGTPVATIFTTDPSAKGSTWHIALQSATVGSTTIIFPQVLKATNSVGTNSPWGVIEAENNIFYPSIKGFHTLGNKVNLLNILATDEISVPLRNALKSLSSLYSDQICSAYWRGKLLWGVPNGSTTNNEVWGLDLERRSWMRPWSLGVKFFVEYTNSNGVTKLLAYPVGGTKLIEFDEEGTTSDSGMAFATKLSSGLIHWDDTHISWRRPRYAYIELSRPQGQVTFRIVGLEKNKAARTIGSVTVSGATSSVGFGWNMFSSPTNFLSEANSAPTVFSQSSIIKRVKIKKRIRAFKWEVLSSGGNAKYGVLRIVIPNARRARTSDPSSWR